VEGVEQLHQHHNGFLKMLKRFYVLIDEGFANVYLHEARQGHHILYEPPYKNTKRSITRSVYQSKSLPV